MGLHPLDRSFRPVQIPDQIYERVGTICSALPEVTVRVDPPQIETRSTAYCFDIRRRPFCLLIAVSGANGRSRPRLVLRADQADREVLLSSGRPFFAPRGGPDRIGVQITRDTDWEEIRQLVTESYRILAPKKLSAQLD